MTMTMTEIAKANVEIVAGAEGEWLISDSWTRFPTISSN